MLAGDRDRTAATRRARETVRVPANRRVRAAQGRVRAITKDSYHPQHPPREIMTPPFHNRIRKVCALVAATLILPALAYAQNNQGDNQPAALQAQITALKTTVTSLQNSVLSSVSTPTQKMGFPGCSEPLTSTADTIK